MNQSEFKATSQPADYRAIALKKGKEPKQPKEKGSTLLKMKRSWQLWVLASMAFVVVFVFAYIPMYGVVIAFQRFRQVDGFFGSEWVGLLHFRTFINGPHFWRLVRNTVAINVYQLIAAFPMPILLALAFNELKDGKIKKISQTITYAPHFISVVVFSGMIIAFMSPSTGIINNIINFFGFDSIRFLERPELFRHVYVWTGIWQGVGWGTVIYLAALSGVDPTLHEAAIMDGATRLQRNWHINIPSILPTIIILLIMQIGTLMSVGFERMFLLHNAMNALTSETIPIYVFQVGLMGGAFSFGAAIGLFNSAINAILLITVNKVTKKITEVGLW